jgi:hypothetical protein
VAVEIIRLESKLFDGTAPIPSRVLLFLTKDSEVNGGNDESSRIVKTVVFDSELYSG